MKTRGAVVQKRGDDYEVIDLVLDGPRRDEVLVRVAATGICRSDDHLASGDLVVETYPFCGGHEGSGVIEAVGAAIGHLEVGDHVVFSFVPACGRCRWCASGRQNLCDLGAYALTGRRPEEPPSWRMSTTDGRPVGQMSGIGTFATHTVVNVASVVKIDRDLPLDLMCLLGCCVSTGWGSAVNDAAVAPGDVVVVMGVGGIGANAVQGARMSGARAVIAVDPGELKRDTAAAVGATHTCATMDEARRVARRMTDGQGADSVIVCVGVLDGSHVAEALEVTRKAGTVVVTSVGAMGEVGAPISLFRLSMFHQRLQGSIYGGCNPRRDIPRQIELYRSGQLRLEELVTRRYRLDDIGQGFADLRAGLNVRGVITFS